MTTNIERRAKEMILDEVERESNGQAQVDFEAYRKDHVKVTISFLKERRIFPFQKMGNDSSLLSIKSDVRRHLRGMGIIPRDKPRETIRAWREPKTGTLGLHMQDAMKEAAAREREEIFASLPAEPEPALPQRIAPPADAPQPDARLDLPLQTTTKAPHTVVHRDFETPPITPPTEGEKAMRTPAPAMQQSNGSHGAGSNSTGSSGALTAKGEPRKRFMFSHDHVFALTIALSQHGAVDKEKSIYTYQPGHSDETVAKAVAEDLPVDKVAEFRRERFGLLAAEAKARGPDGLVKTVQYATLVQMVYALQAEVARLNERLAKVEPIAKELGAA